VLALRFSWQLTRRLFARCLRCPLPTVAEGGAEAAGAAVALVGGPPLGVAVAVVDGKDRRGRLKGTSHLQDSVRVINTLLGQHWRDWNCCSVPNREEFAPAFLPQVALRVSVRLASRFSKST
jgi:hypothetical protein